MNIVYPNLNRQLCDIGITLDELSDATGIDLVLLKKKMQGLLPWKLPEVVKVCVYLKCSDVKFLFVQLDTNTY